MVKVFYWSPFISKIATSKAVINSAISLKKYSNNTITPYIINLFNEWDIYTKEIDQNKINLINLFKSKIKLKLSDRGFLLSRISFIFIFFTSFFPLLRILKKEKPEYIIIHLNTALPLILLFLFNFNTKFILRISGKVRLNFIRKFLWKSISKKIYKITSPTQSIAKELIDKKIFSSSKINVLYDPIINLNNIRHKNCDTLKKNIIAIGRLTKQKNFSFLIKSFHKISEKYNDFSLFILGDGEERDKLQKLIINKNLEKKVFLKGYQKNIDDFLKNSYCFVLTSLWEDPGFVLIEAAINNTLILSSDCETGPRELLENNVNSFVFNSNNFESFAGSFDNMIQTDDRIKFKMKVQMKKSLKKFTLFYHFKSMKQILLDI